jgi:hypothetical protein
MRGRPSLKKSLAALPAVLSVSIAGVLSACSPVVSVQPLYTQAEIQKPYLNQLVEGEWIMANLDDSHEDAATHKPPCTFAGPAQEQLFLLEIFGRATDSLSSSADQGRSTYYYALNRLRNGDLEHCRGRLQDLAKMRPKDDLIGLAAQIELERLPSTTNK